MLADPPPHVGCENKGSSKLLSLESGCSIGEPKAATAAWGKAGVPGWPDVAPYPSMGSNTTWHLKDTH